MDQVPKQWYSFEWMVTELSCWGSFNLGDLKFHLQGTFCDEGVSRELGKSDLQRVVECAIFRDRSEKSLSLGRIIGCGGCLQQFYLRRTVFFPLKKTKDRPWGLFSRERIFFANDLLSFADLTDRRSVKSPSKIFFFLKGTSDSVVYSRFPRETCEIHPMNM